MPPLDLVQQILLKGIVPATLVAGFVLWLANRIGGAKLAPYGAGVGFLAGALLGQIFYSELRLAPEGDSWNRFPAAALIAVIVDLLLRPITKLHWATWTLRAMTVVALAWWVLPEQMWQETAWLAVAYALTGFALWLLLEFLAARPPGGDVPLLLALAFVTAGVVLVQANTARLMDATIVLFAACAGIGVVAAWKRLDAGPLSSAAGILLPGLLLMGHYDTSDFSQVPWPAFALPAVAPLALATTLPLHDWPANRLRVFRWSLVSFAFVAALILARQAGPL